MAYLCEQNAHTTIETFQAPIDYATLIDFKALLFFEIDKNVLGRMLIKHRPMSGYGYVGSWLFPKVDHPSSWSKEIMTHNVNSIKKDILSY